MRSLDSHKYISDQLEMAINQQEDITEAIQLSTSEHVTAILKRESEVLRLDIRTLTQRLWTLQHKTNEWETDPNS